MDKTDLHPSLLFLMIKLEEAKNNPMSDKNFVAALTEVLRYFRDNGELKKAYEIQKDSFIDLAKGNWTKWIMEILASKTQEDGVDVELPNIDALVLLMSSSKRKSMIFYRFGEIPKNEKSCIWRGEEKIGEEPGVSVYEAHKNINGTYSPVIPFPTNEKAFNDFIHHIEYFTGNKYLVTGDLLDESGTDGEPLIRNVKIIKEL